MTPQEWMAKVKKMQDAAAKEQQPEPEPESPRVKELQTEARRLAQEGENRESMMLWVRIWEEKAAAWEAAGKPEYAAAERQQAEKCRQRLASLDQPAIPPSVADVAALYRSMEAMRATPVVAAVPATQKQYIIAPEHRTRPMSYAEAAKLMGRIAGTQDAAEWLAQSVKDCSIPCEHITRQSHVFDRRDFPREVWPKIASTCALTENKVNTTQPKST